MAPYQALPASVCWLVPQFANPNGSVPAIDPLSLMGIWFFPYFGESAKQQKMLAQVAETTNFKTPRRFSDISDKELTAGMYSAIFLPGGVPCSLSCWPLHLTCSLIMQFSIIRLRASTSCRAVGFAPYLTWSIV